jgi:hypothetical protein
MPPDSIRLSSTLRLSIFRMIFFSNFAFSTSLLINQELKPKLGLEQFGRQMGKLVYETITVKWDGNQK